jgi:hypothetical protein
METSSNPGKASPEVERRGIQLLNWCHPFNADNEYLASAADLADLERRIRILEGPRIGPLFVTFNH